jgi:hypothetical protein
MRRIRFSVTYNAVAYPQWSGFVDDWPQEYDIGNKDATVTVSCTDGFKVLNLCSLAESVHWYTVMDLTPAAWWRLGETSGTVALDSSTGGRDGTYAGGATFNSTTGLVVGSGDSAINFDGVDDVMTAPSPVSTFPVSLEAWIQTTTVASSIYVNVPVGTYEVYFEARTDGLIRANLQSNGSGSVIVYFTGSSTAINDGLPHHVVATYPNNSSSPTLYIDGVAEVLASGSLTVADDNNRLVTIGAKSVVGTPLYVTAVVDEVAVYAATLSAGDAATLYGGGHNPWESDGTGARIGKYLDRAAWPSADRTIATGISTLQSVTLGSASSLALSQTVEASEQGQLFMGADGKVIFRDRHWRFENALAITSNATFGDSGAELDYASIVTDGGERFMANHVRATRDGGAPIDVTDTTSIGKFYERVDDIGGLQNQSDSEIRDLANWRLATKKNPIQRVTQLEIKPRRDPANLFPQVLGRDLGDRLTVKRRPQGVGTVLTYTVLIEGVDHTINPTEWTTHFYLSSADSQSGEQPLILDNATYGILDTNVLGY